MSARSCHSASSAGAQRRSLPSPTRSPQRGCPAPQRARLRAGSLGWLLLLLLAGCGRTGDVPGRAALGLRVRTGAGAQLPPGLAEAMRWPEPPPVRTDEAELGRLLFFDPLLSANERVSCASCHQPALAFADGRGRAVGVSGIELARGSPGLWNVAYREVLTWDGRARLLEQQMLEGPFFHPDELGLSDAELAARLAAVPAYAAQLDALYGEVSAAGAARAIAAFERTLLSRNAPIDRYAAGDFYALTGAQRRGLPLFVGPPANCDACHELPTFATDELKIIGVRDDGPLFDAGRGAITGNLADDGAFAVPTLRNVALSAPYMHNGVEPDLAGVIAFYLNGGGVNPNVPRARLDSHLRGFNLTDRELRDLEAFLYALTDESALPPVPTRLPSGHAPLAPVENPARALVAEINALPPGAPRTFEVAVGESVQAALDRAQPGDSVRLAPGRYRESLILDVAGITLSGEGATLVGRPFTPVGLRILNNEVTVRGLTIEGFEAATIQVEGAHSIRLDNVTLNGLTVSGLVDEWPP